MKKPEKILPAADVKKSTDTFNLMRICNEYDEISRRIEEASKDCQYSIYVLKINERNKKTLIDLGYEVIERSNPNGNMNVYISWE